VGVVFWQQANFCQFFIAASNLPVQFGSPKVRSLGVAKGS